MLSTNILLLGGSPIYLRGLASSLTQYLPGCSFLFNSCERPESVSTVLFVLPEKNQKASDLHLRQTMKTYCNGRFLVMGPTRCPRFVKSLFRAGIAAYLLKRTSPEDLFSVWSQVEEGQIHLDPELKEHWLNQQFRLQPTTTATLSKREKQVLQLIVEEFTSEEMARRLFISISTVETHRANILGKLGVRNVAGIVREAMQRELYVV